VVYKATLKKRVGIEVFDAEKTLKPEQPGQVVAVKELQGNCNHHGKSCIKGQIVTKPLYLGRSSVFKTLLKDI